MHDTEQDPHAGRTGGAASPPASDTAAGEDRGGAGAVEVPIGVPMAAEEFRRLKEEARRPRSGADEPEDGAQADEGRDRSG